MLVEDKKEIEDILKYFNENYRDIEQPQNPEESKNQQIQFQNTTLANSLNN